MFFTFLFPDSYLANPHFIFDLMDPNKRDEKSECSVVIALAQRPKDRKEASPIGFRVYKVTVSIVRLLDNSQVEGDSRQDVEKSVKYSEPAAKTERYINMREISLRLCVPPGKYAIIPSTFRRGDEGHFLLRLFLTRGWGSSGQADRRTVRSGMAYLQI